MPAQYPGNAITKAARAASGGGFESAIEVVSDPSGLYPNKPAWATMEALSVDGTIAESNGDAFGVPGFTPWYRRDGTMDGSLVTVVADADNPLGNNSAVNFEWVNSEAGFANTSAFGPSATGYNKLYFMFRVKLIGAGWLENGNKFFFFGLQGGSKTLHYFDRPSDNETKNLRLLNQDTVPETSVIMLDAFADTGIKPLEIDQVLNIEATINRTTGDTQAWVNGVLVAGRNIVMPSQPFNGLEWYAIGNIGNFSQTVNMRLYEWYIAGEAA